MPVNEDEIKLYRRRGRMITAAALCVLVLVCAGILYFGFVAKYFGIGFSLFVSGGFLIFWLLQDVVRPKVTHAFDNKSSEQVSSYWKFAFCEFGGYAGLVFFCLAMQRNTSYYGLIAYVLCTSFKRRFLDEYRRGKLTSGNTSDTSAADKGSAKQVEDEHGSV